MKHAAGLILSIALACAGCTAHPPAAPATLAGDVAHPGLAAGWVRTELYFGLGAVGGPVGVDETAWREFLDIEVTPRFPAGLTVVDAYGQWRGKSDMSPQRLRSKIVVLLHPDTKTDREKIEAIRSAWKARTGDQSVLRVTQPAEVSF